MSELDIYEYLYNEINIEEVSAKFEGKTVRTVVLSSFIADVRAYAYTNYQKDRADFINSKVDKFILDETKTSNRILTPMLSLRLLMLSKFVSRKYLADYRKIKDVDDFGKCLGKIRYILEDTFIESADLRVSIENFYNILIGLFVDVLDKSIGEFPVMDEHCRIFDYVLCGFDDGTLTEISVVVSQLMGKFILSDTLIKAYRNAETREVCGGDYIITNSISEGSHVNYNISK